MSKVEKKTYHHGNLRNSLLDAASAVLREKGVVGLSLRKLATDLGVSHGAPYRHFQNKSELLEALAVRGYERIAEICRQALSENPERPDQQLHQAGMGLLLFNIREREISELMFGRTVQLATGGEKMFKAADDSMQLLAGIFEHGKRNGCFQQGETMDMVLTSLSAIHGLSMFVNSGLVDVDTRNEEALAQLGNKLYSTLMNGVSARS